MAGRPLAGLGEEPPIVGHPRAAAAVRGARPGAAGRSALIGLIIVVVEPLVVLPVCAAVSLIHLH
jgi:hypothetical protein